ncbi:Histidine N-alpha-methyltransferase [Streptomyces hirsutus]
MSPFRLTRTLPEDATDSALRADVLQGLTGSPRTLPPKWFYDARGSELFEEITGLPEYYPTRAEREILLARSGEIAEASGARTLIELGSGSSEKTRHLLDALTGLHTYVPVDVSESALTLAGRALAAERPGLNVHALVDDFTSHMTLPGTPGPRLVAFLGGTIGNLLPAERAAFLASVRAMLARGRAAPRHGPGQGREGAGPGVRRRGRGDGRVQQERPDRHQPGNWAPTSIRPPSTMWPCGTPNTSGSRCACARATGRR